MLAPQLDVRRVANPPKLFVGVAQVLGHVLAPLVSVGSNLHRRPVVVAHPVAEQLGRLLVQATLGQWHAVDKRKQAHGWWWHWWDGSELGLSLRLFGVVTAKAISMTVAKPSQVVFAIALGTSFMSDELGFRTRHR